MTQQENDAMIGRHYTGATIAWGGGVMYDYDNPNPEVITVEDIGWALAGTERWRVQTRHCDHRVFFGVGQHCTIGAQEMLKEGHGPENALAFLWHEADEIVLPNLPGPAKKSIEGWGPFAKKQADAFLAYHCIPAGDPVLLKAWDLRMLITEKRDLLTGHTNDRFHTSDRTTIDEDEYKPFDRLIIPATIQMAALLWINMHNELTAQLGIERRR